MHVVAGRALINRYREMKTREAAGEGREDFCAELDGRGVV